MPPRFAALAPLAAPDYRRLWLIGLCLNTARWVDLLAMGWLALTLTGSPLMVGIAAFCRSVPLLAFGPFGGSLADRLPRRRLLLTAQALALAAALGLAALFGLHGGTYSGLVAMEIVLGLAWAIDFPVRRTALFAVVGSGGVTGAISLETFSMQIGKLVGPALAGLLLGRVGAIGCYVALAVLYVTAIALTRGLPGGIGSGVAPAPAAAGDGWRAGIGEVWKRRQVRVVLVITVIMNVLVFPYQQMLPVFARDVFHVGPELLGLMVAADGLGALLAALAVAAQRGFGRHGQIFAGGSMLAAVLLLGFTASPWYGLSVVLLFAMGLAESGFATMQSAMVLLGAPPHMRGRAMGILSACIGTGPFGTVWIGILASRIGAPLAVAVNGLAALVLMQPVAWRMLSGGARPSDVEPTGESSPR